jgi:hypothetical protein
MKKTLLFVFTFFGLALSAQLTQANHAPTPGQNFGTYQCDSLDPGAAGAGVIWNYATVNVHTSMLKNYIVGASTSSVYPSANVAVGSATNNTFYYGSSPANLNYYGGNISANGVNATLNYGTPAVFAAYPMSMGTTTTSATAGTVYVTSPFPTSFNFTGNCSVLADGTGTLVLPSKTFTNVMRVATSQTITSTINVNSVNYDYYAIGISRYPILTIATSTISSMAGTSTQTVTTLLSNYDVVSVNENEKASIELTVFPNPTTNLINFSTPSIEAVNVIALDVTGKVVATEVIENKKAVVNTTAFSAGVYMYQVTDKNNHILTSGKFTVSK